MRAGRFQIGAEALGEHLSAGWVNKPNDLRGRKTQTFEISKRKICMPLFLVRLLGGEFRKVAAAGRFKPFGSSTEKARGLSGKNIIAGQPTNVSGECVGDGRACLLAPGKTCRDRALNEACGHTRALGCDRRYGKRGDR